MHDTPCFPTSLSPRHPCSSELVTLAPGQCLPVPARSGTAIVALEGDVLVAYRDYTLAWLDGAVSGGAFVIREGTMQTIDRRGLIFLSGAHGPRVHCAIQSPETRPAAALARRWMERVANWTRLPCRRGA